MKYIVLAMLSLQMFGCAAVQIAMDSDFKGASTLGTLQPGMSEADVRQILGTPESVSTRRLTTDTRSVWNYKEHYLGREFATLAIFSFGFLLPIAPADYRSHWIVFSNGVVVGWDLPDPYAPDIIIEKRER